MRWESTLVFVYVAALAVITAYSLIQAHLLFLHYRWKRRGRPAPAPLDPEGDLPRVTVQVPLYNERLVAGQIIDVVAALEWPANRLEIQIVDDSTDETRALAARRVSRWRARGVDMVHVTRDGRDGYKAGALARATERARGAFIAIFDADFLPSSDFLLRSMAYFDADDVGIVQARWGHANARASLVTRLQQILLDGFYLIEQPARVFAGYLARFNGSAGIWRRACIDDAGGWSGDTLSEDLDLSFRAQLGGWRVRYAYEVIAEAELPLDLGDFKEQQFRWTKGKVQVIRKLGRSILAAPIGFMRKLHAFGDLLNIVIFPAALLCTVLSVPMALLVYGEAGRTDYIVDTSFALVSLFVWIHYVIVILGAERESLVGRWLEWVRVFPPVIAVVVGITFHQTVALLQGLSGSSGEFVRTPKVGAGSEGTRARSYASARSALTTGVETLLALYFVFALVMDARLAAWAFVPLHVVLAAGYGIVAVNGFGGRGGAPPLGTLAGEVASGAAGP